MSYLLPIGFIKCLFNHTDEIQMAENEESKRYNIENCHEKEFRTNKLLQITADKLHHKPVNPQAAASKQKTIILNSSSKNKSYNKLLKIYILALQEARQSRKIDAQTEDHLDDQDVSHISRISWSKRRRNSQLFNELKAMPVQDAKSYIHSQMLQISIDNAYQGLQKYCADNPEFECRLPEFVKIPDNETERDEQINKAIAKIREQQLPYIQKKTATPQ